MAETPLAPSWDGGVVLDIGGDVGAFMLHASPTMVGREIDLIPDDPSLATTHSAVRERVGPAGTTYAAVYPHLLRGSYRVGGTDQRVVIVGGSVSELDFEGHLWVTD